MTRKPVRPIIYKDDHALVELTQGQFAKIDIENACRIGNFNWFYIKGGYAARMLPCKCRQFLHRFVNDTPPHLETDHINGNTLDNRKSNLRSVTHAQNQYNKRKRKPLTSKSSSKFKGVCRSPSRYKKWQARIVINGEAIKLGGFMSEEAAARAYDFAAVQVFGEYASLNF